MRGWVKDVLRTGSAGAKSEVQAADAEGSEKESSRDRFVRAQLDRKLL